jgi:hypothetical protein
MCTFLCLYCVLIGIHSVTFEILSIVRLLSNRLCPIIVVIVHYFDTGMYSRYFDPKNNIYIVSE